MKSKKCLGWQNPHSKPYTLINSQWKKKKHWRAQRIWKLTCILIQSTAWYASQAKTESESGRAEVNHQPAACERALLHSCRKHSQNATHSPSSSPPPPRPTACPWRLALTSVAELGRPPALWALDGCDGSSGAGRGTKHAVHREASPA